MKFDELYSRNPFSFWGEETDNLGVVVRILWHAKFGDGGTRPKKLFTVEGVSLSDEEINWLKLRVPHFDWRLTVLEDDGTLSFERELASDEIALQSTDPFVVKDGDIGDIAQQIIARNEELRRRYFDRQEARRARVSRFEAGKTYSFTSAYDASQTPRHVLVVRRTEKSVFAMYGSGHVKRFAIKHYSAPGVEHFVLDRGADVCADDVVIK